MTGTDRAKARILAEIVRTAAENGGVPLGQRRFEAETGIPVSDWRGRHWARWGDAVQEAGFDANRTNEAYEQSYLIEQLTKLTIQLRHFPTYADTRLARQRDPSFPGHQVFSRTGTVEQRVELVRALAGERADLREALDYLPAAQVEPRIGSVDASPGRADGAVYMLKLGKHYKIGKTFSVPRRHREIAIELPEKPDVVHVIATDDPTGIESYWHRRFGDRRTNGEWFALTTEDVRAFRRRKFM